MSKTTSASEAERGRLEAFSDGVVAIAVTLLILEVKVSDEGGSLAHRLRHAWPTYVAYLISFAVIAIMWINHHNMLQAVHSVDHAILVANVAIAVGRAPFQSHVRRQAHLGVAVRGHHEGSQLGVSLVVVGPHSATRITPTTGDRSGGTGRDASQSAGSPHALRADPDSRVVSSVEYEHT